MRSFSPALIWQASKPGQTSIKLAFVCTGGFKFGMKQRDFIFLGLIILFLAASIIIVLPGTSARLSDLGIERSFDFVLGLDLRGGVQALLEVPDSYKQTITADDLQNAKTILENRTNALGVSENQFQVAGERRILAEFPGLTDPEAVLGVIKETGQMEFVDLGDNTAGFQSGDEVKTDLGETAAATIPEIAHKGNSLSHHYDR